MDLTVMDRLLLLNIMPTEGDITTIRIVNQLRGDLSFSEQEHEDFKILNEEGQIKWDQTTAKPKEVEIGGKAHKIIVKALKKISDDGKLTAQYIDVFDKFVDQD
jgi:hypothetical protein